MDRTHTHEVVALATLSSIFRVAVDNHYALDETFHQKLAQVTPAKLLTEILTLEAELDSPYAEPDYSRNYYIKVLAFNEQFMAAYAAIAGDDALRAKKPAGQESKQLGEDYTRLGCPTLARLFAPARAAKP